MTAEKSFLRPIKNTSVVQQVINRLTNAMMAAASQTVVLADSSKFGRRGFGKIGNVEDVDIIITDSGIPNSFKNKIEDAGVQVIIADKL